MKELGKITRTRMPGLAIIGAVKTTVITVVIGALVDTVTEELENHLKAIVIPIVICFLQKAALLGITFIFWRVLGI